MKITSVRHGESKRNRERRIQRSVVGGLTEEGRIQAKKLAKRLSEETFNIIYCSDAERTKETAKEIIRFHQNVPIEYNKELREINAGVYAGASWEEYAKAREESKGGFARFKPRNGESIIEMVKRVDKFLIKLSKKHNKQHILLITHGGINKALKHLIEKGSSEPMKEKGYEQENCCVNIVKYEGDTPELKLYNCTRHLK